MGVFDELGDGIYRRRYESLDLNIGVVIGTDAVLIIDSRASHSQADVLRDELRTITTLPVRWVVNTHFHWDHTWGNARFPGAEIWGHDKCREEMINNGEVVRQQVLGWIPDEHRSEVGEVSITPPENTFATQVSINIGRHVELRYYGRGHTNSDIVVDVGDVLFVGDLLEEGAPPSFGDSYPLDWGNTVGHLSYRDTIVAGHGDVVDQAFLSSQRDELEAVAALARDGHRTGAVIERLAERGPYPPTTMRVALARGYAQLENEI